MKKIVVVQASTRRAEAGFCPLLIDYAFDADKHQATTPAEPAAPKAD